MKNLRRPSSIYRRGLIAGQRRCRGPAVSLLSAPLPTCLSLSAPPRRRVGEALPSWSTGSSSLPPPPPPLSAPRCWRRMKRLLPLVLATTLAWDASAVPAVSGNSTECNKCCVALASACGATCHDMPCTFKCATCAGEHQQQLHQAGCGNDDIVAWCAGEPAPPPPTPHIPPVSRSAVL